MTSLFLGLYGFQGIHRDQTNPNDARPHLSDSSRKRRKTGERNCGGIRGEMAHALRARESNSGGVVSVMFGAEDRLMGPSLGIAVT
jgi:hypothetical protein